MSPKQDDEFDAELRRLFDDERLSVRPRAGAEQAIVAGAQRVRRRRTVLASGGGTLAVAALVVGTVALTGNSTQGGQVPPLAADTTSSAEASATMVPPQSSPSSPSTAPTEPTTSSTATSPPSRTETSPTSRDSSSPAPTSKSRDTPMVTGPELGPQGYSGLRLGMPLAEAKATGKLVEKDSDPTTGCQTYQLKEGSGVVSGVAISAAKGVAVFTANRARTPEGVGPGSSEEDVKAAYPGLEAGAEGYRVKAGGNAEYSFAISGGSLSTFSLRLSGQDCAG